MEKIVDDVNEIKKLLTKKPDSTLTLSSTTSDFTTPLYPPIQIKPGETWVLGLVSLETYYSFTNITNSNNAFKYSIDNGDTWKTITLPVGCYEITAINSEIQRLMLPDAGIQILPNAVTLGSIVDITNSTYKVDFTVANSIAPVLGFNAVILDSGYNISDNIVNFLPVNSILVNCSIINNSYLNGSQFPVKYSFFPNVAPGRKIVKEPNTITYLPINPVYISNIRVWLTDQDGNSIDFRGETITCRLHLKQL